MPSVDYFPIDMELVLELLAKIFLLLKESIIF